MLWYKSWLDTRWRFSIGFAVLVLAACGIVVQYPMIEKLLPELRAMNVPDGALTSALEEAFEVQATYRGFVWQQWFKGNLTFLATLFAALLGSGSPLSGSGRGVLFSLALPVSRERWIGARAATGLMQLFALVVAPSIIIALLSPLIGQRYGVVDAALHGTSIFIVAAAFYGLALLLSTVFNDLWRPLLLTCLIAMVAAFGELALGVKGPFAVMSAEAYFRGGSMPWTGLIVSVVVAAALVYAAAANVARRDF